MEDFLALYFQLPEVDRVNVFKELIHYFNEKDFRLAITAISTLQLQDRQKHTKDLSNTVPEQTFRDVVSNLAELKVKFQQTDVTDLLERVLLYTTSAKEINEYIPGTNLFKITLKETQMVHVNFAGLGSEHLGEHPAIVWDTEQKRDHVLVIPCTSYKTDTTVESETAINIGFAGFFDSHGVLSSVLNVSTVVLLDQIQSVSRKRITRHKTTDPATQKGGIARIGPTQVQRIEEGMRILFFGEKTYFEKELLDIQGVLPEFSHELDQYLHMHRSNYTIITDDGTNVKYNIDGKEYEMIRRKTSMNNKERKKLLKEWNNPRAKKNRNGDVIETTTVVRQHKYQEIKSNFLPVSPLYINFPI
jgi:mRNA-degrading endonuclease toxin of MazEF toxin-antitoxin module